MNWTPEQPFQALALTGGGYRGLYTAKALQTMEDSIGEPIGRHFDLLCGTSIGGIVALAAAFEVPMRKVVDVFEKNGAAIFPASQRARHDASRLSKYWDLFRFASTARYGTAPLREAITALIPPDALIGDALHPLAIPAVNLTEGHPQVFKTRHVKEWNRDWRMKAVDVAMATSAAPTFFELAEIGNSLYADGGLFANAPDLVAVHEAEHFFKVDVKAIRLLSIGTTTKSYSVSYGAGRDFGISDWMEGQRLLSVMISSQQQFVEQLVTHRLGANFLRIDHEPSQEQADDLGLDVATLVAKKTLMGLAEKSVSDILGDKLQVYLKHQPQLTIFREP